MFCPSPKTLSKCSRSQDDSSEITVQLCSVCGVHVEQSSGHRAQATHRWRMPSSNPILDTALALVLRTHATGFHSAANMTIEAQRAPRGHRHPRKARSRHHTLRQNPVRLESAMPIASGGWAHRLHFTVCAWANHFLWTQQGPSPTTTHQCLVPSSWPSASQIA